MKRWLAFVSLLALAVALGGVLSRIPRALSEVEAFRVREVRLRGQRFLTLEDAIRTLNLSNRASVWDDTKVLEARMLEHPLVKEAEVHRRFPGALLVRVVEKEPVALFPNPTLEPVDEAGRILPIDPVLHKLDLPLMMVEGQEGPGTLSPASLRTLAVEIQRLAEGEPDLYARISDYTMNHRGEVTARFTDSPVALRFRPGLQSGRIHAGFQALEDARTRFDDRSVVNLDLRFANQVVVRLGRTEGN